jgi:hypothetical protein
MSDETADEEHHCLDSDALIADLQGANTSFSHNEEAGERRVQFFIGLFTAVIAALVALGVEVMKSPSGKSLLDTGRFVTISMIALALLFVFGLLTFFRIVRRDCVTEEYKAIASYRRKQLGLDDPFELIGKVNKRPGGAKKVNAGGLAQLMATINGIIVFVFSLMPVVACPLSPEFRPYAVLISALIAIGVGYWQFQKSGRRRNEYRDAITSAFKDALERQSRGKPDGAPENA